MGPLIDSVPVPTCVENVVEVKANLHYLVQQSTESQIEASSNLDMIILNSMAASLGLVSLIICMLEISATFYSHFLQVLEPGHCYCCSGDR